MTIEDRIFNSHYNYYKNLGIETIKQQAGEAEQVSKDYEGRVIFELLQNAFDKAERNIKVEVQGDCLYIANDGKKFTYNASHDYQRGSSAKDKFNRYDFQSLCSISTSSKITSESIGNKGVGFKSVFSIARQGYVNVYTKGLMIDNDEVVPETISFGIFDSIKNAQSIPSQFPDELTNEIKSQIKQVQLERSERGVPGYYYPFHITEEPDLILDYFDKGYVTVIEIQFQSFDIIKKLFDDIRKIHFNFVSLKYGSDFNIEFKLNEDSFVKTLKPRSGSFFYTSIKDEVIGPIAKEANVQIGSDNKVAIYFKTEEEVKQGKTGLLYNYLPTTQASPFLYADFHADFHTSINRKIVEFDTSSNIGKYNSTLLNACLELYFSVISTYNTISGREELNIRSIDTQRTVLHNFHWGYLKPSHTEGSYTSVRQILKFADESIHQGNAEDNKRYSCATDFFLSLASKFFQKNVSEYERIGFFENMDYFIKAYTYSYGLKYNRSQVFKRELSLKLLEENIQLLPNIVLTKEREILYKEKDKEDIFLPEFMGINVTTFKIPDEYFSNCLGIKKYADINVLFKYFRQVSIKGEASESLIAEADQIKLLVSLFRLYKTKTDKPDSFVHRYSRFLSDSDRKYNSAQNITAFSVSTVFLKTTAGLYKPAQCCEINELDKSFLQKFIDNDELQKPFLTFLGVSPEQGYLVVDKKIHSAFSNGVDYIPATYSRDETENLTAKEIIPGITIINGNNEVHPALINYNRYPFLQDISNKKIQKELYPLKIGDYDSFPPEYSEILVNKMKDSLTRYPQDVFRLYSANTFRLLAESHNYLIVHKGKLQWRNDKNFSVAQNRNDFDLLKDQDINLLCFFNGNLVPENLRQNMITFNITEVEINNQTDITDKFKQAYEPLVPYILAEISYLNSSISEKNYIKNLSEVKDFQKFWNNMSVKTGDRLKIVVEYQKDAEPLKLPQVSCWYNRTLYLDNSVSTSQKSYAIARSIFNIGSLSAKIELIFFHKKPEELRKEYNREDIDEIVKMWLPEYDTKFKDFQKEILQHFNIDYSDSLWYLYNESNKSKIIADLEAENRLNELIQVVNNTKEKEEYKDYFENFCIEIDRSHIESRAADILSLLEETEGNGELEVIVKTLSGKLGSEMELDDLYRSLVPVNTQAGSENKILQKSEKQKEIEINNRIDEIISKFQNPKAKDVESRNLTGNYTNEPISVKSKKIIFQGNSSPDPKRLESIGATGEEEVLLYFINEFICLDINNRKKAINLVYELLQKKIGDDSLLKYKEACLNVVHDDENLRRALIPFFYVTMHHKFSFFDLIVFYEDKPTLVEVKTTSNNRTFYLSSSEVEAARGEDNYIIVRNTSDCIYLLGNPIKSIERGFTFIQGDNFSLRAKNYELTLNQNILKADVVPA